VSTSMRIVFFFVALITMVCLAVASILMAQGQGWLATLFFVLAFVLIGFAFMAKRRVYRPQSQ
jgi:uncharacterized membrane protein